MKKPKQRATRARIVVLGSINTDYVVRAMSLPQPGQTVQGGDLFIGPGGKGANQAVAAARLGAQVSLIGRVGDEERGRNLVKELEQEGIDTRHVSFDPKRTTGAAIIAVDRMGEKQISAALGANLTLTVKDVQKAARLISQAHVLLMQFESPLPCILAAARLARKYGVKAVLDPAPPIKIPTELFKLLYAIRPNSDEAEKITGVKVKDRDSARRAAAILRKKGIEIVALQAGETGDLVSWGMDEVFVARRKVKSVDATGAGDAFAAGLATAIAEGLGLGEMANLANVTAALSTTKEGARAGMPTRKEVERMLRRAG